MQVAVVQISVRPSLLRLLRAIQARYGSSTSGVGEGHQHRYRELSVSSFYLADQVYRVANSDVARSLGNKRLLATTNPNLLD